MANNRMWIEHTKSGKKFYLARNSGFEWSSPCSLGPDGYDSLEDALNEFFEEHLEFCGQDGWGDRDFKIGYEIE